MNEQQRQDHEQDETMQVESEEQEQGKREIEVREENLPSRAAAVHEQIRMEGEKELERDGLALLWSAIAAGLSMGASLAAKGIFHARLPDDPSRFFIENLGYTFGFIIVIMARQQLFTENTVTAVLPIMHKPTPRNLLILLRLWGVVLLGNLIGTGLAALAFTHMPLFDAETRLHQPGRRGHTPYAGRNVRQRHPGRLDHRHHGMDVPGRRRGENLGDRVDDLPGGDLRFDAYRGRLGGDPVSGVQRRDWLASIRLSVRPADAGGQHHRRHLYLCADQPRANPQRFERQK